MSCTNCFDGCVEVISDKCIKYTGDNIPCLDINTGDSLHDVIGKISIVLCDLLTTTTSTTIAPTTTTTSSTIPGTTTTSTSSSTTTTSTTVIIGCTIDGNAYLLIT